MKKLCTLLAACALSAGLTACGQSSLLAPESPSYDGGSTIGSGNRAQSSAVAQDGGFTAGSGNSTESTSVVTSSTETTTEDGATAERGGYTYGSGH